VSNLKKLFTIVLAISGTACDSGPDSIATCLPNCGPDISPITVEAGPQIVAFEGTQVTLSGSATHAENLELKYQWSQRFGPKAIIDSTDSQTITFIAPFLAIPDFSEEMSFLLTVTGSDGAVGFDTVQVEIQRAVAFGGCFLPASQTAIYALNYRQCTSSSTAMAGDTQLTMLISQIEIESNDSIALATAFAFPQRLASERIGTSVTGKIGSELPEKSLSTDRSDYYIFSPPVAGTFDFKLCRGRSLCSRGADKTDWRLSLRDQDDNELAYAGIDSPYGQSFAAYLDAGVPYYISVTTPDAATAGGQYLLSIISD
jgi:hypothetical protein